MGKQDIPAHILGKRPENAKEFAQQQNRIARFLEKRAAEEAAKRFEQGEGKK